MITIRSMTKCSSQSKNENKNRRANVSDRPKLVRLGKHQRLKLGENLITLRRGEFKGRDDCAPWRTVWLTSSRKLRINRCLTDEAADDDDMNDSDEVLLMSGDCEPASAHSYFVDIKVDGFVPVRCECCQRRYSKPIKTAFKLFLDEQAKESGEISGDLEIVPFPLQVESVDLTAIARSWIEQSFFEEEFLCDACQSSEEGGVETWSLEGDRVIAL